MVCISLLAFHVIAEGYVSEGALPQLPCASMPFACCWFSAVAAVKLRRRTFWWMLLFTIVFAALGVASSVIISNVFSSVRRLCCSDGSCAVALFNSIGLHTVSCHRPLAVLLQYLTAND